MIVNDNFIFIRVPRTASSSMERLLRPYHQEKYDDICQTPVVRKTLLLYHAGWEDIASLNEWMNDIFKFAFVRNPYDRVLSYYIYYRSVKKYRKGSFEEFVRCHITNREPVVHDHWCDQHHWVTDRNGKITVDYLGRFENLRHDFNNICKIIKIKDRTLPWIKYRKHKPYYAYYNKELAHAVYKRCRKDFELFGYNKKVRGL